jgi:hypothetical protein
MLYRPFASAIVVTGEGSGTLKNGYAVTVAAGTGIDASSLTTPLKWICHAAGWPLGGGLDIGEGPGTGDGVPEHADVAANTPMSRN